MTRTRIAAALIAGGLLFTGCSTTPGADTAQPVAPLTAETTAAAPTGDAADAAFLAEVRENLPAKTQIPNATDEQLLDAGKKACERRAAGEPSDQISVIDGETTNPGGYFVDSGVIITAAMRNLCS